MTDDDKHEFVQRFAADFKKLVRQYFPKYPTTDEQAELLMRCQDETSCYKPFNWS